MNKSDLIFELVQRINIPRREAASIVNVILDTMSETLTEGENIEIRGFGNFTVRNYKSYEGRNPRTGEKIKVVPKKLPCFRLGRNLREKMNER